MRQAISGLLFVIFCHKTAQSSERSVITHILENYDRRIRPVHDESQITLVYVQLNIIGLLEVNAPQEYIKLAVSFDHRWHDEFLTWDPLKFNGTKKVRVPADMIWRPDVTVVTAVLEAEYIKEKDDLFLNIFYDGSIYLNFPIVLTNYCAMKTDTFPFDTQVCTITLSSWLYANDEMILEHTGKMRMIEHLNTEWEMFPYESETTDFFTGEVYFKNLHYHQKIKRKSTYYVWVIIVPTFIVTALSIAGIFAPFNNTGEREEKVTLGLTTLLTLAVILSLVTGEMPRATNLPLLGRFILFEISVCVVSMALSLCIMFLHQRSTTRQWPMPQWLMKVAFCNRRDQVHKIFDQATDTELKKCHESEDNHGKLAGICFWQLNKSIIKVNNLLERMEANDDRKNCWTVVFDQAMRSSRQRKTGRPAQRE
uniref:Uncharacterized protein n=1 Tax=Plectus sambesii TaxID=2011161 RepID=A0A914UQE6_9BILA